MSSPRTTNATEPTSKKPSGASSKSTHRPPDERDETWLAEVARRGWIVLSKDLKICYRGLTPKTIGDSLARIFVLKRSENLTGPEMAEIFVKALPAIHRQARRLLPPFIAKVGKDGSVVRWWPVRSGRSRKQVK